MESKDSAEIIIVTHLISLRALEKTLEGLKATPSVKAISSYYPMEEI